MRISDKISEVVSCFKSMHGTNLYIGKVVKLKPFIETELQKVVEDLILEFDKHIELLSLCEPYMRDREEAWRQAVIHKHLLNYCADNVLEQVNKLKTEYIL